MKSQGDNLGAMFATTARDYPERTFLRWCRGSERITWSYAEAAQRIEALIERLDALAIKPGDNVVIYTHEMVPSILFDVACACAGVVFAPIETSSVPAVLELCKRIDARAVLTTPDRGALFEGTPVVTEDGRGAATGNRAHAVRRLLERTASCHSGTVYMLQPTSGTTGGSKLVIRSHAAFVRVGHLFTFGYERETEPPARVLMVPALTHGMGQYLLAMALPLGAELGVTREIDVAADIHEIRWLDPTHMALTPRVLNSLFQQLGGPANTDRVFGPSAKFMISSGAAPDKDLLEAVERTGVHVVEAFGASEISVLAMVQPGQWRRDILGIVLDDVKLKITEEGELLALTPVMMNGYYGAPEITRASFTDDGFYRTGDRVVLGPNGEFIYMGRVIDSFNLFDGSHVAPGPIEEAIARLPWLEQVLLIGDQRPYLTGFIVPHRSLRESSRAASLHRMIEREVGRICSTLDPNARVRRLAILDHLLPEDVHKIVGHGKVRRKRDLAIKTYADVVRALYGAIPSSNVTVIEIPGAAAERRASSRRRLSWPVRITSGRESIFGYTQEVSRGGGLIEHADPFPSGPITVEVIEAEGHSLVIEAELVRRDASATAVRWTGPAEVLAQLAERLPP